MQSMIEADLGAEVSGFLIHGLIVLERGYIFTCMVLAAVCASLIDRRFFAAGIWSLTGAALTLLGLCHSYQLIGNAVDYLLVTSSGAQGAFVYRGPEIAVGYVLMAAVFVALGMYVRNARDPFTEDATHV